MTVFVVSVLLALSVSFLCSLMEATLLSLTPSQIALFSQRHPQQGAIWQRLKADIERPIAVILMLNTTAHTIGASVGDAQFDALFGAKWVWLFGIVLTFVMLQYTEILPKTLGVRLAHRIAPRTGTPLLWAVRALSPVIQVIYWLNRPFEGGTGKAKQASTVDEIAALATLARFSRQISPQQEQIIQGAARLAQTPVSDLMIPAEEICFLSTGQTLQQAFLAAHIDAHTRYPVCQDGDRDRVVGYVNFKELVSAVNTNPAMPTIQGIMRPMRFVEPQQPASELVRVFVEKHEHIAIVRDAIGKTRGLVTFEDAVEELVGELGDEFDRLPKHVHALGGRRWMIGGGVTMKELAARTGLTLPAEAESVAAHLERRIGRAVNVGDQCAAGQADLEVRRVRRRQAFEVAVTQNSPGAETAGGAIA